MALELLKGQLFDGTNFVALTAPFEAKPHPDLDNGHAHNCQTP